MNDNLTAAIAVALDNAFARGVAAERVRCIKVLEALSPGSVPSLYSYGKGYTDAIAEAIAILNANDVPVASSPVGGEQR